ncbi:uncharacterized protein LOC122262266 [Penaeus japonicus]|uniref:uncharacterized protein LOC122262266 n=1 Tax=Penaeus japonicus TaxID=27405 RepID=UPI001C714BAB|nr:uncharacterized protein LOC122262266 [Penaeus japonicus]
MATSSTDAFNTQLGNNIPLYSNNYSMVSVTTGPNFWPTEAASSSTSPASENNWDVDEEEAIKRRIYELKRQFHNGRYLIIRHLPRDATEEVRWFACDADVWLQALSRKEKQTNKLKGQAYRKSVYKSVKQIK